MPAPAYDLPRLRDALRPARLVYLPSVGSTNDEARRLRARGELPAPAVVLAGEQTAGRGTHGRTWHAPPGTVCVTFVRPASATGATTPSSGPASLTAGVAVRRAVAELGLASASLKWPNDVYHGGLKLAGLLCERASPDADLAGTDLIGVGLNLNVDPADLPPDVAGRATSLLAATGRRADSTDAVLALARHLAATADQLELEGFAPLLAEYERHHRLAGRRVRVTSGGESVEGWCDGVDRDGRLVLSDCPGLRRLAAGTVEVIDGAY